MNTSLTLSLSDRPVHAVPQAMNYATAAPATAGGQQNGPVSIIYPHDLVARHSRPAELYLLSTIDKDYMHQHSTTLIINIVANV